MLRKPPDVLITTPESLYLMLTSRAREMFASATAVIVDEIHAVARTKRGAHLALTLERLEHAADDTVQRIGLSATQNPLEEVGPVPGGHRPRVPGGGHRRAQAAGPEDPRAGRGHARARRPRRDRPRGGRPGHRGRRRRPDGRRPRRAGGARHAALDLARHLPRAAEAGAGAPEHDHLREQPPRRRAAGGAAERAGGRRGQAGRDRPRPPRLAGARGAAGGRGPAEVRRPAVPGGHVARWSWASTWAPWTWCCRWSRRSR